MDRLAAGSADLARVVEALEEAKKAIDEVPEVLLDGKEKGL